MTKPTLHIPQKDSPSTYLTAAANIGDTRITVADSSIFQLDPNNPITRLTLGFDTATTETVEVIEYGTGNIIKLLTPLTYNWGVNTKIARVFTSNDLSEVHQYLEELNSDATDLSGVVAELSTDVSVLTGDYNTEVAPILNLLSIVHQKRHIFRGAFLGSTVSNAQNIAIQSGTFNDLYLGDYWYLGGQAYRIIDFNYWQYGLNPLNPNHLVIAPDVPISSKEMDLNAFVKYYDTTLREYIQATIYPTLNTLFGFKIAYYTENLPSESSIVNEVTCKVELMSETQLYGQGLLRSNNEPTYSHSQFSLFKIAPEYIHHVSSVLPYWLRDQAEENYYCSVGENGMATYKLGSSTSGIRPCFPIFGNESVIG